MFRYNRLKLEIWLKINGQRLNFFYLEKTYKVATNLSLLHCLKGGGLWLENKDSYLIKEVSKFKFLNFVKTKIGK